MEWQNQAIILGKRPFGERFSIVDVLTEHKGIWRGIMGISKKDQHFLQPGCLTVAHWKSRLSTQLGRFHFDILSHPTYVLFQSSLSLELFNAACALILQVFPQQEPYPELFQCFNTFFLKNLQGDDLQKATAYILLEKDILTLSGFSLDLSHCAVTGQVEDLTFVSPKTGRAVSTDVAQPYKNKLLALPQFLRISHQVATSWQDILNGLQLTGHFLQMHLLIPAQKGFSPPRLRLRTKILSFL